MPQIHPASVVEPGARIADDVSIGPFCTIGADVELGPGVALISHVSIAGSTIIGDRTRIYPFASIGHPPQDKKFAGEKSRLEIGADNVFRESVSINPGTAGGGMLTSIGDRNLFMLGSHVAHDCRVGSDTVFANNATLAGHVVVEDFAVLTGLCAVHQFCRIGRHSIIGGMTGVERDVIPYGMVMGDRARLVGLNLRGLQRRGFDREQIAALRDAYEALFADGGTLQSRLDGVADRFPHVPPVMEIVEFMRAESKRGIVQPHGEHGG